jgi:undecaprenyl-diphosphatase
MFDYLSGLLSGMQSWGYVIVFVIVMLECQAFLGLFMPGESLVVLAGFLAAEQILNLQLLIPVVAAAAIIGDTIGYELGRWLGRDWLRKHGPTFWLRPERLDRMDAFFVRHGGLSVLFAHFLHVGRALMPFLAGAARFNYLQFLLYNATGCILWAATFSLVGYWFGQSWHLLERWIGRASIFVLLFAGLVIATIWFWRWLSSREQEIRRWWEAFRQRPRVVRFRHRFATEIDWVEQRFSPEGFLGIYLTVGVFLLIAAAATFGGFVQNILTRDAVVSTDLRVARWFEGHTTAGWTEAMLWLGSLGSLAGLSLIGGITALVLLLHRHWYRLLLLLLAVPGGALLDILLTPLFGRPRPRFGGVLHAENTFGLPSGDTMTATVLYGALAAILLRQVRRWQWRVLIVLLTIVLLLVIGFSRLYLGAYYFSDILTALIEGAAWLLFCISGVALVRWRAMAHATPARARDPARNRSND